MLPAGDPDQRALAVSTAVKPRHACVLLCAGYRTTFLEAGRRTRLRNGATEALPTCCLLNVWVCSIMLYHSNQTSARNWTIRTHSWAVHRAEVDRSPVVGTAGNPAAGHTGRAADLRPARAIGK